MMELGFRQGVCTVATVVVLVLAGCCFEDVQGSRLVSQPQPQPGVVYPYYCPHDITLTKLRINQSENPYVQYTEYATKMPSLTSFTIHYWFNLEDTTSTSTMFQYGSKPFDLNDYLTVQLQSSGERSNQYLAVTMNSQRTRTLIKPHIRKGEWHHALHSWNSATGELGHFLDGNFLQAQYVYETKGHVIPGGGVAVSGQHQNTLPFGGTDLGEGLNGWFTLFHLSSKPIGVSSSASALTKAKLAFQCSADMGGDVISWTTTPRKGYGGVTETPSDSKACGRF